MARITSYILRVFNFYLEGFRNMSWWGRRVWFIIIIKLFIMFLILRLFFFHDFLASKFESDKDRSMYVLDQLTKPE